MHFANMVKANINVIFAWLIHIIFLTADYEIK